MMNNKRLTHIVTFIALTSSLLSCGGDSNTGVRFNEEQPARSTTATGSSIAFEPKTETRLNTWVESDEMSVAGLGTGITVEFSVENGEYSLNGSEYKAVPGFIKSRDTLQIRTLSPAEVNSSSTAVIRIGDVSSEFTVFTSGPDARLEDFEFAGKYGVPINTSVSPADPTYEESETYTVGTINVPLPASIEGGEFSINGGEYDDNERNVEHGDEIKIRVVPSDQNRGESLATLTIGEQTAQFSVVSGGGEQFFGINFNESMQFIETDDVFAAGNAPNRKAIADLDTKWVRGFLELFYFAGHGAFLDDGRLMPKVRRDELQANVMQDIEGLRILKNQGHKIVVSLKVNLRDSQYSYDLGGVPFDDVVSQIDNDNDEDGYTPSTTFDGVDTVFPTKATHPEEYAKIEAIMIDLFDEMWDLADIVVVGNEPFIETNYGVANAPMEIVDFYGDLAERAAQYRGENGGDVALYFGAINRGWARNIQSSESILGWLDYVKQSEALEGVDIHPHHGNYQQLIDFMEFVSPRIRGADDPAGMQRIIATELSFKARWKANNNEPLDPAFVQRYNIPASIDTCQKYVESLAANPNPGADEENPNAATAREWADFVESQPWYLNNQDYLTRAFETVSEYEQFLGAFTPMKGTVGNSFPNNDPWVLNALYANELVQWVEGKYYPLNYGFHNHFRRLRCPLTEAVNPDEC